MGWQDAPTVDSGDTQPAWKQAPTVSATPAGPTKEDVQAAMSRRQLLSVMPFGGAGPEVAQGMLDPLKGIAQAVAHLVGQGKPVDDYLKSSEQDYQQKYQPSATLPGASAARVVGSGLTTAAALPVAPAGVLGGAAVGAASGALEPVQNAGNDFWIQKAKQAGLGAVTGGAMTAAGKIAGKVVGGANLSPEAQTLADAGVQLTPGQVTGGVGKSVEDKLTSMPMLGDLIQKRRFEGITDFNKAVYSRALQPFGDEGAAVVKAADVGNKGIAAVGDFLSNKYEQALAQSAPAPFAGSEAEQAINNLAGMVPQSMQGEFSRIMQQQVLSKVTPAGTLTPSVAKQADSALGAAARQMVGDQRYEVRELAGAIREAQSTLREAFAAANPDTAPMIRAADQGWSTLVQMERAGGMVGAKDGIFTPAQLLSAIKRGDTSIRDRRFARGEVLNQDLAQAADKVLPNKIPDSGTVGRAIVNGTAAGGLHSLGALLDPHTLALMGTASLPYLPVVGPALTSLSMLARPQGARDIGALLQRLAPYTSLLAGGVSSAGNQ